MDKQDIRCMSDGEWMEIPRVYRMLLYAQRFGGPEVTAQERYEWRAAKIRPQVAALWEGRTAQDWYGVNDWRPRGIPFPVTPDSVRQFAGVR